jgi:hypothetical protein
MWWVALVGWLWILAELDLRLFGHKFHESNLPNRLGVSAFTIGRHVMVAPGKLDLVLMAHERAHVEQFRRFTYPGFFLAHAACKLRYGYNNNPLELEARALARLVADQMSETKGLQK